MREAFDVYQRFLQDAQQHGLLRPDGHERLVDATRVGQWTEQELWDAITAALATSEEQPKTFSSVSKANTQKSRPLLRR